MIKGARRRFSRSTMSISEVQQFFSRYGFVAIEDVFSLKETETLAQEATRIAEEELAADPDSIGYRVDSDPSGQLPPRPRKIDNPFRKVCSNKSMVVTRQRVQMLNPWWARGRGFKYCFAFVLVLVLGNA